MDVYQIVIRLFLSLVIGGLIGIERADIHRPAGFRTHTLVCLGSTIVMVTGEYAYHYFSNLVTTDPLRLGAQVISGIGFLGAGTIIKQGDSVKGLTTAASLWAVACLGLAIGTGAYLIGVLGAISMLVALWFFGKLEYKLIKERKLAEIFIDIDKFTGISDLEEKFNEYGIRLKNIKVKNLKSQDLSNRTLQISAILIFEKAIYPNEVVFKFLKENNINGIKQIYFN